MIPVPKPKFFERKVPAGQSEDDYFDEISERQTHILGAAIDRVSFKLKFLVRNSRFESKINSAHLSISNGSSWNSDVEICSNCF